jgi:RHS repeat-associated protein
LWDLLPETRNPPVGPYPSSGQACQPAQNASFTSAWVNIVPGANQLLSTNQSPGGITYDAAGNVIYDGANYYLYDGDGRICAVASVLMPSAMTGYVYDASGARAAKGSITTWSCDPGANGFAVTNDYVLGFGGEQVTEEAMGLNGTMAWQHTNVWAAGKLIGTYDSDGLHFYLNDPLGTRRVQTDYAGVIEQTCSSLPFGDGLSCTNSSQFPTEHHFTGKERDSESGNDYFGARYYASSMGRFLSPDWSAKAEPVPYAKLDDPQSLNLYAYVGNNPLTHVDLDGHAGNCPPGSFCEALKNAWNQIHQIADNAAENAATKLKGPLPQAPSGEHFTPKAPSAGLHTDMSGHSTTFTTTDPYGKTATTQIETRNDLAGQHNQPDADGPFSTDNIVGVSNRHGGSNPSYGPPGAFIDVGDTARGREIHGGGSRLPDPFADHQGWYGTNGCTRGQNIDVINLGHAITDFQHSDAGVPIPYTRDN